MSNAMESAAHHAGPPWIQPQIQEKIKWRDGDVVISVPAKSGTTWTMNIVHQLLTGGTSDFRDIYEEVPWIEFVAYPGQPHQEVLDRLDAMPHGTRRAFKTHSAPPVVPFLESAPAPDVKYIVVVRNPEEALVSFRPFIEKHSDEWFELWGMPREAMARPDFASFYEEVIERSGMHEHAFFGFLNAWWPLRERNNVLFLHYADMKGDHEGSIRKIAEFLKIEPTEEQWPKILAYTSFPWMKQHEDKFEASTAGRVPILKSGAMIRKGEAGDAKSDGMTDEISRHLRAVGERVCGDLEAVEWFYKGSART
ncbi:sulfotransferase domain-containing protein [Novosphingobium album (ex Hu et al. 2023)]|uniref:Sulfotransferase domain-containing protein n=1 Tax=Novosphingobium album (ex Hu et al. 2023) TaxID=2930093 RepID=A0ABT0AZG4_9SPHN|nr:sulfotransferase domain-containing protein [Novosphingobium album (ex Hu et al. 2023)]MCJ2178189.1 sulfotransferase domain-containing protein [Novosphingobium album (ex Hu et al. 2023)]